MSLYYIEFIKQYYLLKTLYFPIVSLFIYDLIKHISLLNIKSKPRYSVEVDDAFINSISFFQRN